MASAPPPLHLFLPPRRHPDGGRRMAESWLRMADCAPPSSQPSRSTLRLTLSSTAPRRATWRTPRLASGVCVPRPTAQWPRTVVAAAPRAQLRTGASGATVLVDLACVWRCAAPLTKAGCACLGRICLSAPHGPWHHRSYVDRSYLQMAARSLLDVRHRGPSPPPRILIRRGHCCGPLSPQCQAAVT